MESNNFSPSVNIIRDQEKNLVYHVTPNSLRIAKSIVSQYNNTGHCFNLIGSYGTGKSSFLLALEKNLKNQESYFFDNTNIFSEDTNEYQFINIIGGYYSFKDAIAKQLSLDSETNSSDEIISAFENYTRELASRNIFLVVVVDEYGKFLEYACNNNTEENIYFIQQLAECINSDDIKALMITSMHQNFNQYGAKLKDVEKNEWLKVNGRFIDLTFNEPIEQLVYLSALQVKQMQQKRNSTKSTIQANSISLEAGIFINKGTFDLSLGESLYPLDFASSYILTKALQIYGQNERSLFTFLNQKDYGSLYEYIQENKRYTISSLYDFLYNQYYGFIVSSSNPFKSGWDSIRIALERIENIFDDDTTLLNDIVKTIGLLNIFAASGAVIDHEFLKNYIDNKSITRIKESLKCLKDQKIIRFREYAKKYILFEGTDVDFEAELEAAKSEIDKDINVASHIDNLYTFPYLYAKAVSYRKGTPRIFKYEISEFPIEETPNGELDGYVNLIFCKKSEVNQISLHCKTLSGSPILYGIFTKTGEIKNTIINIEKCRVVKGKFQDDRVAVKELNTMISSYEQLLQKQVLESLGDKDAGIKWFVNGKKRSIESTRQLNAILSEICDKIYTETPVFINELINKHKISTAISTARKNYLKALLENVDKEDLGFAKEKFPAEKTIYLSLLKNSGIHKPLNNEHWGITAPEQSSNLYSLWIKSEEILDKAKEEKLNLQLFYNELSAAPYKLKEGFLNFWIQTYLILKQDDFALFNDKGYIPFITIEVLDLIHKKPSLFSFKTFSTDGIKLDLLNTYRDLVQKETKDKGNRAIYIDTIRPLFKFYRNLPSFTKHSKRMSPQAIGFRDAISKAEDPETAFFVNIPNALGYSGLDLRSENVDLNDYLNQLRRAIRELRECEADMIQEVESHILKCLGLKKEEKYSEYKAKIDARFSELNRDLLLPHLKRLVNRLTAPVAKKGDWIKGLFTAVIAKGVEQMKDNDVSLFVNNFKKSYKDLERLVDIHKMNQTSQEEVFMIDILDNKGETKKEHIYMNELNKEEYNKFNDFLNEMFKKQSENEMKQFLVRKLQEIL